MLPSSLNRFIYSSIHLEFSESDFNVNSTLLQRCLNARWEKEPPEQSFWNVFYTHNWLLVLITKWFCNNGTYDDQAHFFFLVFFFFQSRILGRCSYPSRYLPFALLFYTVFNCLFIPSVRLGMFTININNHLINAISRAMKYCILVQSNPFIPTFDITTKFIKPTIWMERFLSSRWGR